MNCLTTVFTELLSMGWTALPVMAAVLAARLLLRRAPRKCLFLLWAAVAFRLVCPVTVTTPIGLTSQDFQQPEAIREFLLEPSSIPDAGTPIPHTPAIPEHPAPAGEAAPARQVLNLPALLTALWLAGMAAAAGHILRSSLRLRRLVRTAVRREGNVWECGSLPSPLVLGLLRPRIYIPFHMEEPERTYVLAHEREHLRWKDHWIKALALLILTVYWWHPGVWLCWGLLCRDMELRCDEAVLAALGSGIKQDYSRSLLAFALDRRFPAALAFGEHDAVRRVKHVLAWKKSKPAALCLALAAVVLVAIACGTNAARSGSWVRSRRWPPSAERLGEYAYRISRNYHSFLLYQERYDHGELTARELLAYGALGNGPEEVPRRGVFTLDLEAGEVSREESALLRQARWRGSLNNGAEALLGGVPADAYGETGWGWQQQNLAADTAVAVAALAEEGGQLGDFAFPDGSVLSDATLENDIVLVLRLRLSEETADTLLTAFETEDSVPPERTAHTADQLFALSLEDTPDSLTGVLLCRGLWGIPGLAGHYRQVLEDGVLTLNFDGDLAADPDTLDQYTARNAALLLLLRPELTEVRWNSSTAERSFDRSALSMVLSVSSDSQIHHPPQSAEDVRRLMNFLNGLSDGMFTPPPDSLHSQRA